ncbi:MAG TPA: FCD domain-containing protein [Gaiellales bacterium]|jgi:DNA-binding FadR family transcriptional regulator|nr:FCD domain-containing protein [Gaiellales bacterium]
MSVSHLHLVTPRPRRGALEDVVARIGVAVDLGLLAPGDRLPDEAELAGAFDVAPITMRRALRRLCDQGLLVRRRGRSGGTFVSSDPAHVSTLAEYQADRAAVRREAWDLLDYRLVLEAGAIHLAADRATLADVARLRALVDAMDEAKDWPAFRSLDPGFHLSIASVAAPRRAVDDLTDVLGRLRPLYFPHPMGFLHEVNAEHRAMVEAIANHDGAAAAAVLTQHLTNLRHDFFLDPAPDP